MNGSIARKGISLVALAAMLTQGAVAEDRVWLAGQTGSQGLCRQPTALPKLGAEAQIAQQQPPRPMPVAAPAPPAPPPPPPPSVVAPGDTTVTARRTKEAVSDSDTGSIVVTGSAPSRPALDAASPVSVVSSDEGGEAPAEARPMPAPEPGIAPRPRPQPRPQAGILTAGEHDDLLNPELYSQYQRRSNLGQQLPDLPRLDTTRVLTVAVKDEAGRPVPFAPVEVACSDGGKLVLTTTADGTVSLFPDVDQLGGKVQLRAAGQPWRAVAIGKGAGGQRVDFTQQAEAQRVRKLDLMLVIDTTGSMGDEIRYLQSELGSILGGLQKRHPGVDIRVGFVFYRDMGDDYVTHTVPLSGNFQAAQAMLVQQSADGGGDYPEAMDQALIRAANQPWRRDAVKTMLLVADAPPHDDKFGLSWQAAEVLRHQRVQIVPVAASGVADKAEYAMRAMAALTQSRYTFLTDDSGVGNSHAAPAIDCYLVTRLNSLLLRVIDSQLSGRRVEPAEQEVIRTVGKYDNGKCILPPGGLPDQ